MDHFISDLTKILACKGLHIHTKRAVLYKAIEDYSKILIRDGNLFWSKDAQKSSDVDCIREHPVPKSVITNKITPKDENLTPDDSQLEGLLTRAFSDLILVCTVTKVEDKRLSKNDLKSAMPQVWDWNTGCAWDRYKEVEIDVHR
jgi:hypothetical protein